MIFAFPLEFELLTNFSHPVFHMGHQKRKNFFGENPEGVLDLESASTASFSSMQLSRPILRGIASIGYSKPTVIQATAIPVALLGKDICAAATTGSGKPSPF
jgi:ATP-dependent RNA helicase DDX27